MPSVVAVDIGGTFTDLVAFDHATGRVSFTKAPTTYDDFVRGIVECVDKTGVDLADVELVNHGTTLVINALIQRRGAKTALLTSRGFRDILEIARGNRPDPFNLYYQRDEPLIPRDLRFEIAERMSAKGEIITPLDLAALDQVAADLTRRGIEAVAVFFINSFANPAHEIAAAERLRTLMPGVSITRSTDLSREWYEYERVSTAASNAFVAPQVNDYLARLHEDIGRRGFDGSLFMMGSNGGILSAAHAGRQPIALVESGPIGGCIGASVFADDLGLKNLIAFDMGGTTAKCALVEDGRFSVDAVYYVGGYVQGFPIKSPVIDIVEVGSGGGSIAWLDAQKRLHVGPRSAGSTPGPVCYGRGGGEPTVTDANLILGRINAEHFLGGELHLDTEAAARAVREKIAGPLGYEDEDSVVRLADGIISIATVIMAGAVRRISVEHGRDPRDFVLFCYGGGGPLHAGALARELSIPTIMIPPEPGNFSALGMLLADARLDDSETFVGVIDDALGPRLHTAFAGMEDRAQAQLAKDFPGASVAFERFAEMRYRGQRHNIKVPLGDLSSPDAIRAAFDTDYRRRYGHADSRNPVEFQALHLSAFAKLTRPDTARLARPATGVSAAKGRRAVFFGSDGFVDTPVYDRYRLEPGFGGTGPAILEEYGSSTVVWPGDRFEIGALHQITISVSQPGEGAR